MKGIKKITIIGAGCIGSYFAREFFKKGFVINEIIARAKYSAIHLAHEVNANPLYENFENFRKDSDLYILAVKDEAIFELRKTFKVWNKIIVHTSGSVPSTVFNKVSENYGVLYPLQSIIKYSHIDISTIPFFITASNDKTRDLLHQFISNFSPHVHFINDEKRKYLHLAAVFASNFTNYLLYVSQSILESKGMTLSVMKPLVQETIRRAFEIGPEDSQTGPARRGDCQITDMHKNLLHDTPWEELYSIITDLIREKYKEEE